MGDFDPKHYRRYTSINTDFRKIQDGIKMTVCLPEQQLQELRKYLESEHENGRINYGISVQDQAVLTCFVPSITSDSHYHFLDGAGGGYAEAATNMKIS